MQAHRSLDHAYAPASGAAITRDAEQRWVRQYLPLVRRIVSQLSLQVSQALDREDMEQIGLMGLLECLRRYGEPDEHFRRFAALRIRGAILDELRRQDWRPRQLRQQVHKVRDVIRSLSRQQGRAPQEDEILAATGLSREEYQAFLRADYAQTLESLDELLQSGHEHFPENGDALEERMVKERLLEQALTQLSERERLILTLYYQHELSLREIALVLDLTDARVCQLSKQAIAKACRFLTDRA